MPLCRGPGPRRGEPLGGHERLERGAALSRGAVTLALALLAAGLPLRLPAAADDSVLKAARDIRREGCRDHRGTPAPLQRAPGLDEVARRWARGGGRGDLGAAFAAAGVRARRSASLALLRTPADRAGEALSARLCAELTDPAFRAIGLGLTAEGVWIVVAEPSEPPTAGRTAAVAAEVLRLSNAVRARGARCGSSRFGPAPPLTLEPRLSMAARVQAEEMARHGVLAHEGRDGSTPAQRVTRTGYAWQLVGENVAAGPESAAEVVDGWEHSPEHCRNLMDPAFTQLGIAFATSPRPTGHSTWWSMVLARPRERPGR